MTLRVQYMGQLRTAAGRSEDEIDLREPTDLASLLAGLADRLDQAGSHHLVSATGQIQCGLLIVVNGAAVAAHQAATTTLRPGDVITLLPPIAGG
jgi:molybdopterin converting factor small subunit